MIELAQAPQPICLPHDDLAKKLAEGFDEHPVGNGMIADGGSLLLLFAARDGSSWTLVIRHARASCIALTGRDWSALHVAPPKQPERGI